MTGDLPDEKKDESNGNEYRSVISEITKNIRKSRFLAARSVNKTLLLLYFSIGRILDKQVQKKKWGSKVLEQISTDIQREFPGIRGFSPRTLRKTIFFFQQYSFLEIWPSLMAKLENDNSSEPMRSNKDDHSIERDLIVQYGDIDERTFKTVFFNLSFTHHMILLQKCPDKKERFFYMRKTIQFQWSYRVLQYHIESGLYVRKGQIENNFEQPLPLYLKTSAINSFKDEYLLDFLNVNENDQEYVLEQEIVKNVKDFLMSLGDDFTYIANQYRLIVGGDEFFIDLLFYHRTLRSLIAVELKNGKFKPEYVGKMQFYLTALDDLVKHDDENRSIGIILCKDRNKTVVEYTLRDTKKPIGIAKYKVVKKLPIELKDHLPKPEDIQNMLNDK